MTDCHIMETAQATILNFSGRSKGNGHHIAAFISESVSSRYETVVKEMCSQNITPCGKCDCECFQADLKCPFSHDDAWELYNAICASDRAYYIVPNYCDYPNARFFIFNERGQCFFQHQPDLLKRYLGVKKKFIVISNTEAVHFREVFKDHVAEHTTADVLFLSTRKFGKVSIAGDLMDSAPARLALKTFIQAV